MGLKYGSSMGGLGRRPGGSPRQMFKFDFTYVFNVKEMIFPVTKTCCMIRGNAMGSCGGKCPRDQMS